MLSAYWPATLVAAGSQALGAPIGVVTPSWRSCLTNAPVLFS